MECACSSSESILLVIRAILITLLFGLLLHKLNQIDAEQIKQTKYRVYVGVGIGMFILYFVLMAIQSYVWYTPIKLFLYGLDLKVLAYIIYSLIVKEPYVPFL